VRLVDAQPSRDGRGGHDRLHQVCLAVDAGLGMSGAAVLLRSGRDSETLAASSTSASGAAAELEHTLGEGPSRDALTRARPVLVDDLRGPSGTPWVAYAAAVAQHGVRSVFAFPLHVGAARFGTLTMYGATPQQLDRTRTSRCLAMAELATESLLTSADSGSHGHLDRRLESALAFRNEIYQAQGMAMVTLRTDLADALARMRAHAYQNDRTLLEVSLEIVGGRLTLTDEGRP
jgi:transcriptional regulator with GAF, ATPase, and Fis domain